MPAHAHRHALQGNIYYTWASAEVATYTPPQTDPAATCYRNPTDFSRRMSTDNTARGADGAPNQTQTQTGNLEELVKDILAKQFQNIGAPKSAAAPEHGGRGAIQAVAGDGEDSVEAKAANYHHQEQHGYGYHFQQGYQAPTPPTTYIGDALVLTGTFDVVGAKDKDIEDHGTFEVRLVSHIAV